MHIDISESDPAEKSFRIYQSYIFSGGDYKSTTLKVIIYDVEDDMESLYSEIKSFHETMNGSSDELCIGLYDSKESLLNGETMSERTYVK